MRVKEYLKKEGITFKKFEHPPVYTCEEAKKYTREIKGIHSKNLFIKDKKSKRFYLMIMPADKKLDIQEVEELLKDKIKFANENDLQNILGINSGAVSPFNLINDKKHKVQIVINKSIWESDYVSFHPNINTETIELTKKDFHKYINSLKNKLAIIK